MSVDHDYPFANSSNNQSINNRGQDERMGHPTNTQERREPIHQVQYSQNPGNMRTQHIVQRPIQKQAPTTMAGRTVVGRVLSGQQFTQSSAVHHHQNVTYTSVAQMSAHQQQQHHNQRQHQNVQHHPPPQQHQQQQVGGNVRQVIYRQVAASTAGQTVRQGTIMTPNSLAMMRDMRAAGGGVVSNQAGGGVQQVYQVQQQPHYMAPRPVANHQYINQPPQQRSMNLAVPLREPSPEPPKPAPPPPAPAPVPAAESTSNEPPPEDPNIDIQIRNVVCNYTLPLHIDLRKLAMYTNNVTYEREKGVMMKQKRNPNCYIKVYSSGKVYIVGCRSEDDCRKASRSIARHVQRVMGKTKEKIAIRNYRINNVLATCRMPFGIKIEDVAAKYPSETQYEPELSVGLIWRSIEPKATLRIHTTGSITVTGANSEEGVLQAISNIYDVVEKFRCPERAKHAIVQKRKRKAPQGGAGGAPKRSRPVEYNYGKSGVVGNNVYFSDEDEDLYDDLDLEE